MAVRKVFKRCDGPGHIPRGTGVGKNPKENLGMLEVPTVPKAGVPKDSRKGAGGKIRCVGWDHIPG